MLTAIRTQKTQGREPPVGAVSVAAILVAYGAA
jgi:hypothetical protein